MFVNSANYKKLVCCNNFSNINRKQQNFRVLMFVFAFFVLLVVFAPQSFAFAESDVEIDKTQELSNATKSTLEGLDFSGVDEIACEIDFEGLLGSSFDGTSSMVSRLISGEEVLSFDMLLALIKDNLYVTIKSVFFPLGLVLFVVVVSNLIYSFKPNVLSLEIGSVVSYASLSIIIIILSFVIKNMLEITNASVSTLSSLSSAVFPVLLLLLSGAGAVSSSASFGPFSAIVSSVVTLIFKNVLMPIILVIIVLNFASKLTHNSRLDYLAGFFNSLFKWVTIACISLITSFVAIKGTFSSIKDGFSIKAAKFALKNYIPFLGGYLSDGFDFIKSGSVLVKNSVGVVSIIFLVVIIIKPIVHLLVFSLMLKLVSGVTAMIDNSNISKMLRDLSSAVSKMVSVIAFIAFIVFVFLFVIICTGNSVL